MSFVEIVLISLALSMDAMTVSISAAAAGFTKQKRATFRLAFHFGLFQFLMPILGWLLGITIIHLIEKIDHWVVFILLSFVGLRMIMETFKEEDLKFRFDPSRGLQLVGLSVATSLDAMAVGLTLAFVKINIWYVSVVIGLITGSVCVLAIKVGHFLRKKYGKGMEILAGIILIAIGFKILLEHLQII